MMRRLRLIIIFTGFLLPVIYMVAMLSSLAQSNASSAGSVNSAGARIGLNVLEQQVFGKKYDAQPSEERIRRLERAFKRPSDTRLSMSYRLSELYAMNETKTIAQKRRQSVDTYNRGIDAAEREDYETAIASYRKAIDLDPKLVEGYNNLGNLLMKLNRFEEATLLYQRALEVAPEEPLLHRNLGVLYERLGRIESAVAEYQTYLKQVTEPDPPIEAIVDSYQKFHHQAMALPDYATAATRSSQGRKLLWRNRFGPVLVHVRLDTPEQAFVAPLVRRSLDAWELAANQRLQFKEVADERRANILVVLREKALADPYSDVGHTEYQMTEEQLERGRMDFVTVTLNIGDADEVRTLPIEARQQQIYRMALHEMGHAIGIWGHSPDPGDVMFTHPIASQLSNRDVKTIQKLYGL